MEFECKPSRVPDRIRRVVTGHAGDGGGVIAMDGVPPRTDVFRSIPGLVSRMIWATGPGSAVPHATGEVTAAVTDFVPAPGETRFLVLTFPPDSVFAAPEFNPAAAAAENLAVSPGLAERFEPDGMHATPTIDYAVVLDGEIWLDLDGVETCLSALDVLVQTGTRHAWRNKSDRPATIAVVLVGASTGAQRNDLKGENQDE